MRKKKGNGQQEIQRFTMIMIYREGQRDVVIYKKRCFTM